MLLYLCCSSVLFLKSISLQDALRVLQPQSDMADSLDPSRDTEILDKLKDVLGDFFASRVASDAAWAREILGLSNSSS